MAKQAPSILASYFGANLASPSLGLVYIPCPAGTLTDITIVLPANVSGDTIFTVYKQTGTGSFSSYQTITITSGTNSGTVTSLATSVSVGDTLRFDLTTVPATINAPIDFIVNYTQTINADDSDSLGGTAAANYALKSYVDSALAGLSWKQACRVATTANGTLSTAFANGQTVDGVTLATGNRILIKNQSSASENGIYTVNASGAPTRATDADSGSELVNAAVYISEGTANADKQYVCTTNATITLGSTSITFTEFSSGSYTDEQAQDAIGAMVDSSLVYTDATPLLQRAALTGDVTAAAGSNSTTIANDAVTTVKINNAAVTLAKINNASANDKLLGSGNSGSGASYTEITLGSNLSMSGTTLNASPGTLTEYTSASSAGAGSIYFAEDTDNGSNKITVTAPSSIASDKTQTLQDATGTIALTSDLPLTFKTISVSGQSDVVADSTTDTLTLVAGTNVTITTNAGTDSITISASGGGGGSSLGLVYALASGYLTY